MRTEHSAFRRARTPIGAGSLRKFAQAALGKKPFPVGNGFLLFVLSDSDLVTAVDRKLFIKSC